jgi:hypothetical protein
MTDPGVLRVLETIHGDDGPDEDDPRDVAGRAVRAWLAASAGEDSSEKKQISG